MTAAASRARASFAAAAQAILVLGLSFGAVHAGPLDDLAPGSWLRVPRASLQDAAPPDADAAIRCADGPASVVSAWSGAAYDERRHALLVWGGGHRNYCGNEVYAFDVTALAWRRLTDPSPPPFDRDPLGDGRPAARHTYDGLQYLPGEDRLFAFGGSRAADGNGTRLTWLFDPGARSWRNAEPAGDPPGAGHVYNLSSAYDPVRNEVLMRDPKALYAYEAAENRWTKLADAPHTWSQQRGALDTKRRLYFTIGSGEFLVYDLERRMDVTADWHTSGGEVLIAASAPGLDYDADDDILVGWHGGAPYVLDVGTRTWARLSGDGAPAAQQANGTFGRFRYLPDVKAFILVNAVDAVYFLRPPARDEPAQPKR